MRPGEPAPERPREQTEAGGSRANRLREPLAFVLLLLVCLCAVALLKPDGDLDVWHRLAVGKLIVESGEVTRQDPFAYTPKKPEWIDHEWGAAVAFYGVASLAGQQGLLLLKAGLMFGTLWFQYLRARRALGRPPSLALHVLLVGALAFGFMASIRPQVFSFFLFSLWLYLLERARDGDWRRSWLVPVSNLAWANLHGGFVAGLGLVLLFGLGELLQRRPSARFWLLALAASLASLASPYGLATWSNLFEATTMERSTIREWQSWDFFGPQLHLLGFRVLFWLTVVALCARAVRKNLPDLTTILVLVVTAVLGLRVLKHVTLFVIASGPFVCAWVTSWWDLVAGALDLAGRPRLRLAGGALGWLGRGLLLLATGFVVATVPLRIVLFDSFPARALDFIAQNRLEGNLLAPFNFGAYAIWRLYPACRVAMDSRYEAVYPESTFQAVRGFFNGEPGWSEFLDQFPHDIVLAQRKKQFEANMAKRSDWAVAYEDGRYRVYVRSAMQRAWPPLAPHRDEDPFSTAGKPRFAP